MLATQPRRPHRRRQLAAAVAAAVLAVGLAACGSAGDDASPSAVAADQAAFPATIAHKYGTTTIPAEPKRVVTIGYTDHDYVLALGVTPVGVRDWFGDRPNATWAWAQDALGDAKPEVLPSGELNFEQIASLRPDLILGVYSGIKRSDYTRLSKLAPTVTQTDAQIDYGMPWQDQLRITGRALGRSERAEELVTELEASFAKAREDHPEFDGASAVFAAFYQGFAAYAGDDPRPRFLRALGLKTAPEIDKRAGDSFFVDISNERLREIDKDVVVMYGPTRADREQVLDNPLYKRLNAVKEGRDVYLDGEDDLTGALSFSSPLSIPYALAELVPRLAAAIDGDPETRVPEAR
ncbi:MAG: iron-siderophore ABC transporter substrate-binding protein [Solirubrobacteraceae bacterium]|nr:iron-siderophore ABC transporter substrate-binding protein [Solirubrobacteraceae bacterium]